AHQPAPVFPGQPKREDLTEGSPTELAVSYRQNSGGDLIFSMAPGSGTGSDRGPAFPGVLVGLLRCCGLAWGVADLPG
ncbi:MAG TPA: hypothetical protein VF933_16870, partial [Streptosporangiaceae bacterium]